MQKLINRQANWDGYGSDKPDAKAIEHAERVIKEIQALGITREPHISSSEKGEVVMEWWNSEKKLTLYVDSSSKIEYLKSDNACIEDMEVGDVGGEIDLKGLFDWVYEDL